MIYNLKSISLKNGFWFVEIAMELKLKNILAATLVRRLEKPTKENIGNFHH